MNIFFSETARGFYPSNLKLSYQAIGSWPADAVQLTALERDKYWKKQPPAGKKLGADASGRPLWVGLQPPTTEQQAAIDKRIAKYTGELYSDTGVIVPFTNEAAIGVMQVKNGFDAAKELVSLGSMTQAEYDALNVNLEISDTVSLPLTPETFIDFAAWFWPKRGSFF